MIGLEQLWNMRNEGYAPECVFIRDVDSALFSRLAQTWRDSPNEISGDFQAEIVLDEFDDPSEIDFSPVDGLNVYINGDRSTERLRGLFRALEACNPHLLVAFVDGDVFTYNGERDEQ